MYWWWWYLPFNIINVIFNLFICHRWPQYANFTFMHLWWNYSKVDTTQFRSNLYKNRNALLTQWSCAVWQLELRIVDVRWRCQLNLSVRRKTVTKHCTVNQQQTVKYRTIWGLECNSHTLLTWPGADLHRGRCPRFSFWSLDSKVEEISRVWKRPILQPSCQMSIICHLIL